MVKIVKLTDSFKESMNGQVCSGGKPFLTYKDPCLNTGINKLNEGESIRQEEIPLDHNNVPVYIEKHIQSIINMGDGLFRFVTKKNHEWSIGDNVILRDCILNSYKSTIEISSIINATEPSSNPIWTARPNELDPFDPNDIDDKIIEANLIEPLILKPKAFWVFHKQIRTIAIECYSCDYDEEIEVSDEVFNNATNLKDNEGNPLPPIFEEVT